MNRLKAAGLFPFLLLAACNTVAREKPLAVVEKNTAVAVSCLPSGLKPPPRYPYSLDQIRAAPDDAALLLMLGADVPLLFQRVGELEPVVEHCKQEPPDGPNR